MQLIHLILNESKLALDFNFMKLFKKIQTLFNKIWFKFLKFFFIQIGFHSFWRILKKLILWESWKSYVKLQAKRDFQKFIEKNKL